MAQGSRSTPQTSPHKHVFYSESAILSPMIDSTGPLSAIVEAFSTRNNPVKSPSIKGSLRRKASFTSTHSSTVETRTFAFSLPLPQKAVSGDQLPPTMSSSIDSARPRTPVEKVDVSYRLVAVWEPHEEGEERAVYVRSTSNLMLTGLRTTLVSRSPYAFNLSPSFSRLMYQRSTTRG